jgi:hypothetical protein
MRHSHICRQNALCGQIAPAIQEPVEEAAIGIHKIALKGTFHLQGNQLMKPIFSKKSISVTYQSFVNLKVRRHLFSCGQLVDGR